METAKLSQQSVQVLDCVPLPMPGGHSCASISVTPRYTEPWLEGLCNESSASLNPAL